MIKILSVVLFSIFYNFKSYCGCCGPCCVDPKVEIGRQYEKIKIEDKDILNKDEGYKAEDYEDIIKIADVELSLKNPEVTSKLNFNSILSAKKYFFPFYDAYLRDIKKENAEEMFNEGFKCLVDKLVKDIGDKAKFNFDQINDYLVFETEWSFKNSKYDDFNREILSSENFNKICNIIYNSIVKESEFKVYFEPALPTLNNGTKKLRKQAVEDKYYIVYNSSKPIDSQPIAKLKSLGDKFFKTMKFIFIVFLNTKDFYILLSKDHYDKMEDEYKKKNPPTGP